MVSSHHRALTSFRKHVCERQTSSLPLTPRYLSTKIYPLTYRKVNIVDKSLLFVGRYVGDVQSQVKEDDL